MEQTNKVHLRSKGRDKSRTLAKLKIKHHKGMSHHRYRYIVE